MIIPHDFTPRPYQADFMRAVDAGAKRAVLVWPRRAGKDRTALNQCAKEAMRRVGLYWHMLPSYRQARKAVWNGITGDGKKLIDTVFPPAIRKRTNEVEMLIELKNGSVIQLVGSDNYDSLVGSNPIGVTYSEFALNRPAAWDYVRPILAENGGWAWFISTPRGRNHLWTTFEATKAAGGYASKLTLHDINPNADELIAAERLAGMPDSLVASEYLTDWNAANVGSVWGDLFYEVEKAGGVADFDFTGSDVFTVWDLGFNDATAIWFFKLDGDRVDVIDHYEAHGKPLSHYFDEVDSRGYQYVKHWLPHDARATTLASGVSILEQFAHRYGKGKVGIGPSLSLLDGIQAVRWMLQRPIRFHAGNCRRGTEAIAAYSYEYDEDRKVYSNRPNHDWSSHTADALRYLACVVRHSGTLLPKPPPPKTKIVAPPLTLDSLTQSGPSTGWRI